MIVRHLVGQRFGRLLVIALSDRRTAAQKKQWVCVCDCGGTALVTTGGLNVGDALSCGCLQQERTSAANRTHGGSTSTIYSSWKSMMARCYNARAVRFNRYGGRGIYVCSEWHSFDAFRRDMAPRPKGKTLDRIDNDGPYALSNCRWATPKEQAANRHRCTVVGEKDITGLVPGVTP